MMSSTNMNNAEQFINIMNKYKEIMVEGNENTVIQIKRLIREAYYAACLNPPQTEKEILDQFDAYYDKNKVHGKIIAMLNGLS